MSKRIPVYEQTITLGNTNITVLSTTPTQKWDGFDYEPDDPIGYLELLEKQL